MAKVRGDGNKIGPSITLKVMAGDKFHLRVSSWWKDNGQSPTPPITSILTDLVAALSGSIGGISGGHGGATATELQNSGLLPGQASQFLNVQSNGSSADKPWAFVNWILFDEQFKFVQSGSGAEQVRTSENFLPHVLNDLPITKNGYLYVYVSNETANIDVFFDNLQVTHVRGVLLEENSYYPFGLTMNGINSKALSFGKENKLRFNCYEQQSKEFSDGSGLEWYDYKHRFYDNQIGRFFTQDELANDYVYYSPYQFAGNEVPNAIDLDGLEPLRPSSNPNNRYMSPTQYEGARRAYREVNNYVPSARSYRTLGTYIPNQQAGSAPKPANIYEPFTPGKGDQFTGPFVTNGNTQGQLAVGMTKAIDDLKGQIKRVTFTTDNYFGDNPKTSTTATITWQNPDAEKKFNQLQQGYDSKVQGIIDANKVTIPIPGANATAEEKQKYFDAVRKAGTSIFIQTLFLGPSPTQMILNDAKSTKDFKLSTTERQQLPEIQRAGN